MNFMYLRETLLREIKDLLRLLNNKNKQFKRTLWGSSGHWKDKPSFLSELKDIYNELNQDSEINEIDEAKFQTIRISFFDPIRTSFYHRCTQFNEQDYSGHNRELLINRQKNILKRKESILAFICKGIDFLVFSGLLMGFFKFRLLDYFFPVSEIMPKSIIEEKLDRIEEGIKIYNNNIRMKNNLVVVNHQQNTSKFNNKLPVELVKSILSYLDTQDFYNLYRDVWSHRYFFGQDIQLKNAIPTFYGNRTSNHSFKYINPLALDPMLFSESKALKQLLDSGFPLKFFERHNKVDPDDFSRYDNIIKFFRIPRVDYSENNQLENINEDTVKQLNSRIMFGILNISSPSIVFYIAFMCKPEIQKPIVYFTSTAKENWNNDTWYQFQNNNIDSQVLHQTNHYQVGRLLHIAIKSGNKSMSH